ncbi:MAG: helicase-exonuclease AddAB subunit AddB, partial [Lachnoclostridium sp.]|nr:helicase-exonuclease AddAB subunit AddB [Lachnoclostridium sp.]
MSLYFILGSAGSGKSYYLYKELCKEADQHKAERFFVLVPEQFTLETQRMLVEESRGKGIMNVDVLSFHRLATRIFEKRPALKKPVLEDTGKMMMIRKVLSEQKKHLQYFNKGIERPGFLDEIKSFCSEMLLYKVDDDMMEHMISMAEPDSLLEFKLQDIRLIYNEFRKKLENAYITVEEILPQCSMIVPDIDSLKGSTFCLDGFTGFTPCQEELICELMRTGKRVIITLTMEPDGIRDTLFELSRQTIHRLTKLAADIGVKVEEPLWLGTRKDNNPHRFMKGGALSFLEKNIFAGIRRTFQREQDEIHICEVKNPRKEAVYVTSEIYRLISEKGYRYGEIAVVSGDISIYEEYLTSEMNRMGIRYFIDYKRNIGGNILAEFILSFLEMIRKDFDYESTLRFLRGGLSPLTTKETDFLENYILALGIRGWKSYQKDWPAPYHRKKTTDMGAINQSRRRFAASVRQTKDRLAGGKKTVGDYVHILYDYIVGEHIFYRLREKEEIFEKEGQTLLAKEYHSVYRVVTELFDEMIELLGDEPVSLEEFEKLLGAGISGGLIGFVPPSADQVVIGDVERTRLKDIKVLFMIGVNDGLIPKGEQSPGILTQRERKFFHDKNITLAPSSGEQVFISQFYMY